VEKLAETPWLRLAGEGVAPTGSEPNLNLGIQCGGVVERGEFLKGKRKSHDREICFGLYGATKTAFGAG